MAVDGSGEVTGSAVVADSTAKGGKVSREFIEGDTDELLVFIQQQPDLLR